MIRNSRNYISDHLATKQNKSHEMLANVTPHVTQSQNVPYTGRKSSTVSNIEQLTPATQEQMDTSEVIPVEEQDTEDPNQPLPSVPLPEEKDVSKDSDIGEDDTNQSALSFASGPSKISPLKVEECLQWRLKLQRNFTLRLSETKCAHVLC